MDLKTFKLAIQDLQKKEELLSSKLVHSVEKGLLPSLLNLFTELGSTIITLGIFLLIVLIEKDINNIIYIMPIYFIQLIIVEIIKTSVNRNRPKTLNRKNRIWKLSASSGSFPSGHTANIFTLMILIIHTYSTDITTTIALYLTAILVAISRLYLGRHYIIDIFAGFIIGTTITTILINTPAYTTYTTLLSDLIHSFL